ncbi:hypothetical protein O1L60_33355 [Streptomyces diastatochromogenes]|nr:hypothetical protein [Streptomyces diastatochromogenes]
MPLPQAEPQAPTTPKARVYAMLDTDGDGVASKHDYFVRIERAQRATGRADDDPWSSPRAPPENAPGRRWTPTATA